MKEFSITAWRPLNLKLNTIFFGDNLIEESLKLTQKLGAAGLRLQSEPDFQKASLKTCTNLLNNACEKLIQQDDPEHWERLGLVEQLLLECMTLLEELQQDPPELERKAIIYISIISGIPYDKILNHLFEFTLHQMFLCYFYKKNIPRALYFNIIRIKYMFENDLYDKLTMIMLIISKSLYLSYDIWHKEKMLKQSCYLLLVAETLLHEMNEDENLMNVNYRKCMSFLIFGWTIYAGRLMEFSKEIAVKQNLNTLNQKVIKFNVDLEHKEYVMPSEVVNTEVDIQKIYLELLKFQVEMYKWGPFRIDQQNTSYKVMDKVLEYLVDMFPFLNNNNN